MATKLSTRLVLYAAWVLAVGTGATVMLNYQSAAGGVGATPTRWPARAEVSLDPTRPTLILFAHPQCPCTRATVEELNRLLSRCAGQIAAHVLFLKPDGLAESWTQTDLWRSAAAIPGVAVKEDIDGKQAEQFGAETSGHVVVYNPQGQLLFKGGITGSRGHVGANVGANTIVSLAARQKTTSSQTPVYGCSLQTECEIPNPATAVCTK